MRKVGLFLFLLLFQCSLLKGDKLCVLQIVGFSTESEAAVLVKKLEEHIEGMLKEFTPEEREPIYALINKAMVAEGNNAELGAYIEKTKNTSDRLEISSAALGKITILSILSHEIRHLIDLKQNLIKIPRWRKLARWVFPDFFRAVHVLKVEGRAFKEQYEFTKQLLNDEKFHSIYIAQLLRDLELPEVDLELGGQLIQLAYINPKTGDIEVDVSKLPTIYTDEKVKEVLTKVVSNDPACIKHKFLGTYLRIRDLSEEEYERVSTISYINGQKVLVDTGARLILYGWLIWELAGLF